MTIVQPKRVDDFVRTLLAFYQQADRTRCRCGAGQLRDLVHDCVQFRARDCRCLRKGLPRLLTRNWLTRRCATPPWHPCNHQDEYQSLGYVPAATASRTKPLHAHLSSLILTGALPRWRRLWQDPGCQAVCGTLAKITERFDQDTKFFRGKTVAGRFMNHSTQSSVVRDYTEAMLAVHFCRHA